MKKGPVESYGKLLDVIGHFTQVVWKVRIVMVHHLR